MDEDGELDDQENSMLTNVSSRSYKAPEQCVWNADFTPSVYDDGLLRILEIGTKRMKHSPVGQCMNVTAVLVLLSFNALMQFFVIARVGTIVETQKQDKRDQLFYHPPQMTTGACYQRVPGELPPWVAMTMGPEWIAQARSKWYSHFDLFHEAENHANKFVWDCGPLMPTLLTNVTWLDVDGDGDWCLTEDPQGQAQPWVDKLAKSGNLTRIWHKFMDEIKEKQFLYQRIHKHTGIDIKNWTTDYTCIPMPWMRVEQPLITLCNNVDPMLCGNLEYRGILKKYITFPPGMNSDDRVATCRQNAERCDAVFGELFRSYTLFANNICGEMGSSWVGSAQVVSNVYERAAAYDPAPSNHSGSAITKTYYSFLMVVLVIWSLTVIAEVRLVFQWFMTVIFMAQRNGTVLVCGSYSFAGGEVEKEYIRVESISRIKKAVICVLVLIPRALVVVCLGYEGIQFLICADNYEELILNGVALAFVSEIDEMLFAALASYQRQQDISDVEPLEVGHPCSQSCIGFCESTPVSLPLLSGILATVYVLMFHAIFCDFGKDDISEAASCLCQAEGTSCLGAQIFGGLPFTPH